MRLIDADKFEVVTAQYDMPQSETVSVIIEPAHEVQKRMCADAFISGMDYVLNKIDEAPTVKAIPIEWLKKFAKQFEEREPEMSKPIWMVIEDVINFWEFQNDDTPDPNKPKDWRKENEMR